MAQARAFAEIISYMENHCEAGEYVFKLSHLHQLYTSCLRELNIEIQINKTRFKDQIIAHYSEHIKEQSDWKNILLVFKEGIKKLLKDSLPSRDYSSEALIFAKAARAVRNEAFQFQGLHFTGEFPNCQANSVPHGLKFLVSIHLNGSKIENQDSIESQACLTIAQLIYFNMKKKTSRATGERKKRHCQEREPPLPHYLGLSFHTQTEARSWLICEMSSTLAFLIIEWMR